MGDIEFAGIANAPYPARGTRRREVNSKVVTAAEWRAKDAIFKVNARFARDARSAAIFVPRRGLIGSPQRFVVNVV